MTVKKDYNIGLDIGTESVGWSVVEVNNQKVMRKGNKALWGVRLFEKANTAADRREKRSARRRYDRRRERIKLLQEEFNDEINKVDNNFFQKLNESKYLEKDKINKTIAISDEEKRMIKDYQNSYKTIYHLRNELINSTEKKDIRLVYLAIHHIIKYRGNFLYQNSNFNIDNLNIKEKLSELFGVLSNSIHDFEIYDNSINMVDFNKLQEDMLNIIKNDAKRLITTDLSDFVNKSFVNEFAKLMIGNKANIAKLLLIEIC